MIYFKDILYLNEEETAEDSFTEFIKLNKDIITQNQENIEKNGLITLINNSDNLNKSDDTETDNQNNSSQSQSNDEFRTKIDSAAQDVEDNASKLK